MPPGFNGSRRLKKGSYLREYVTYFCLLQWFTTRDQQFDFIFNVKWGQIQLKGQNLDRYLSPADSCLQTGGVAMTPKIVSADNKYVLSWFGSTCGGRCVLIVSMYIKCLYSCWKQVGDVGHREEIQQVWLKLVRAGVWTSIMHMSYCKQHLWRQPAPSRLPRPTLAAVSMLYIPPMSSTHLPNAGGHQGGKTQIRPVFGCCSSPHSSSCRSSHILETHTCTGWTKIVIRPLLIITFWLWSVTVCARWNLASFNLQISRVRVRARHRPGHRSVMAVWAQLRYSQVRNPGGFRLGLDHQNLSSVWCPDKTTF